METMTKEKLIEILRKYYPVKEIGYHNNPANEILSLHNADIVKYKELVGMWKELDKIKERSLWNGTFKEYIDKVKELRRKIVELEKDI